MRSRLAYPGALLLEALGAAAVLLIALRPWQTVVTPRRAPLPDDVLRLSGRTLDAAPTALALVALAGVVAVIATRGVARRVVGVVVALAGVAAVWRSAVGTSAVSDARARRLVAAHHRSVVVTGTGPRVEVHAVWPWLSLLAAVVVVLAGALVAWHGHRWSAMSSRYDARARGADDEQASQRAATALWSALDRGDDPTEAITSSAPRENR